MRELTANDFDWNDDSTATYESASLVDRHSSFDGNFRSQKDLRIEGELKGAISCDGTIFVAEGASVSATIDAEHMQVAGDVSGEIRCRGRLQIMPSGQVRAKVTTGSLVIQEGAIYEGQLDMAGIERSAPRPLRTRGAAPVSLESVVSERQSGSGTTFIRRLGSPEAPWDGQDETAALEDDEDAAPQGSPS